MGATPLVAIETADGSRVAFTFSSDIDTTNHEVALDRLRQGLGIDYTVTSTRGITFTTAPVSSAVVWLFNGVSGTTIATALPAWDTVAEIVSDAAIECGLITAAISDPFASTDPNILQMIGLLKSGGRRLARERSWTHLQSEYTFSTVSGTATYALPSDFRGMIDQTGWNRTSKWPLGGPTSPQTWQYIQAIGVTSVIFVEFRPLGGQLKLTPTPSSTQTVAFEYLTTSWIKPVGQTVPTSDVPTLATDVVCFDPLLAVSMLKLAFKRAKGLDTTAEQMEYDDALMKVMSDDAPSPVLHIGGDGEYPLISTWNVPDTGYGV